MATVTTNPSLEGKTPSAGDVVPLRSPGQSASISSTHPADSQQQSSQRNTLQALLAFLALHEQVRRRREIRRTGDDGAVPAAELEEGEQFTLDEVLQLVADRAVAITGADGLGIALAENNEIVLRAAAGTVRPNLGARIDRDSSFSGACFRTAQILNCVDTETDGRVNLQACRRLGARSMVAVPLYGPGRGIGLLQAFSARPFGFNDSDVRKLSLLAELVMGALTPEDEEHFAESAQVAAAKLEAAPSAPETVPTATLSAQVDSVELTRDAVVIAKKLLEEVTFPEKRKSTRGAVIVHELALEPVTSSEPTATTEGSGEPDKETPQIAATKLEAAPPEPEAVPVAESEMPALEPDSLTRRPGMLVLLVCIVVISALAGGAWWKLRPSQLANKANKMAQNEKMAPKPMGPEAKDASAASFAGTAANPANINPGAISNESRTTNSPAKPQKSSKLPMVTGIQHWSSADSTTVVLNLEDQVHYEAHRLAHPDRIYFDLRDTQLASNLAWKSIEVGDALLQRIRVAQPVKGVTRIVLETKANTDFSVRLEPNPYRLVVELRKVGAAPKGATTGI
jgi:putative methionine-R-sulfoxide reductase with GAF domain